MNNLIALAILIIAGIAGLYSLGYWPSERMPQEPIEIHDEPYIPHEGSESLHDEIGAIVERPEVEEEVPGRQHGEPEDITDLIE